jgi:hypothetical protein
LSTDWRYSCKLFLRRRFSIQGHVQCHHQATKLVLQYIIEEYQVGDFFKMDFDTA